MERPDRWGVSYISRMLPTAAAPAIIYFLFTWNIALPRGWAYFGVFLALNVFNIVFLLVFNARLLNERGETRPDIKKRDNFYLYSYLLLTHFLAPLVAGIGVPLRWPCLENPWMVAAGIALLLASGLIENAAMYYNRFFERNIRVQNDKQHVVVAEGPYRHIRHPGYLAYILRFLAFPLVLGISWSAIPVALGIAALVLRTAYEDEVLTEELKGYPDYKKKVRYRLLPFVW